MTIRKTTFAVLTATAALAVLIAMPFKASSQVPNNADRHHHHGFAHPEIDAALGHLNAARSNLMNAAHDYGGHRVKALNAVNNAIKQCNVAIQYANTHDR